MVKKNKKLHIIDDFKMFQNLSLNDFINFIELGKFLEIEYKRPELSFQKVLEKTRKRLLSQTPTRIL